MAGTLSIDLSMLVESSARLAAIAAELNATDVGVEAVTSAVGGTNETHELRRSLEGFARTWRVRRERICGDVQYLADVVAAVTAEFEACDDDMARQLGPSPVTLAQPWLSPGQGES